MRGGIWAIVMFSVVIGGGLSKFDRSFWVERIGSEGKGKQIIKSTKPHFIQREFSSRLKSVFIMTDLITPFIPNHYRNHIKTKRPVFYLIGLEEIF